MSQNTIGIFASQISGHLWEPQGAYDALSTVTVPSGGLASITFAGIPSGYKHLQIRILSRTNRAFDRDALKLRFNSDSGNSYAFHYLDGSGSSATAGGLTSSSLTYIPVPNMAGNTATSNIFGSTVADILDYSNNSKNTTVRMLGGVDFNGSGNITLQSGLWVNTAAITTIDITPEAGSSFAQFSQFSLYGVR